jgi:hypothetical protein
MAFVSCLGMMYYLNDRNLLLGKLEPSVVLPDVTNTMSVRFKGLTKINDEKRNGSKLSKFIENIFNEE